MHADRKLYTYDNWYNIMYNEDTSIIRCIFDFDNKIKDSDGYKITLYDEEKIKPNLSKTRWKIKQEQVLELIEKNNILIENEFDSFRLSGDADYELLTDSQNKNPLMHKMPNFSLFPVTGNLQALKSNRDLKAFLDGEMKRYYEYRDLEHIPYKKWGKQYKDAGKNEKKQRCDKEALKAFLDIFDSLNDYCKNMYFLDIDTIRRLDKKEYWDERIKIAKAYGVDANLLEIDVDKIIE